MFSEQDLEQINGKGIGEDVVLGQIENFKKGFPFLPIDRPVCVGDGLLRLDHDRISTLCLLYEGMSRGKKITKFVPASGAATRMFKDLYEYLDGKPNDAAEKVCDNIGEFAFYDRLSSFADTSDRRAAVEAIVGDGGLGYGKLPKGLLLFHRYDDGAATPFEEHLVEGALYAKSGDRVAIHFTVSPEHRRAFEQLAERVVPVYAARYGVTYDISYSEQMPSTDTVAVNEDFTPFRENDGRLLFRPAGHGALIANLNNIDSDIIFIKTVDNVTHRSSLADTVTYKKLIASLLLDLQGRIFDMLGRFDAGGCSPELVAEAEKLVTGDMMYTLPKSFSSLGLEEKFAALREILDRPIRVCGMVRNEGEPGGGPFWVRCADGSCSLQIAESSQIAPEDKHLMKKATHFNPVDLVCAVKDYKGRKFDLTRFVDPSTGFISKKSKEGRDLLAQELPGLWNGAMANWTTLFVEVPISTFNPVKTITDLLRPTHRQ